MIRRDLWLRAAPPDIVELWPEVRQIAALHISYFPRRKGQKVRGDEWHYYLIAAPKRGGLHRAKRIAELIRGHWAIENKLHHILDRTFGEDARRSAKGAAPMALGLAARAAIALLRNFQIPGKKNAGMPEKRIHIAANPGIILRMLR
jgi:predicted transposase YbfD/YdcC